MQELADIGDLWLAVDDGDPSLWEAVEDIEDEFSAGLSHAGADGASCAECGHRPTDSDNIRCLTGRGSPWYCADCWRRWSWAVEGGGPGDIPRGVPAAGWRRAPGLARHLLAEVRARSSADLLVALTTLPALLPPIRREGLAAWCHGVRELWGPPNGPEVLAGLDVAAFVGDVVREALDSAARDDDVAVFLELVAQAIERRVLARVDKVLSKLPFTDAPPAAPVQLLQAEWPASVEWLWGANQPHGGGRANDSGETGQGLAFAWNLAYTHVSARPPIWLVRRPREELRRLFDERWLEEPLKVPGSVRPLSLELGCGLGYDTFFLGERGFRAVGVDFSECAVGHARKEARTRGLSEITRFFAHDVYALPAAVSPASLVYDNSVFARSAMDPETPQTPEDYRALLRRVTRPGSFVFLQVMSEEMADKKVELRRDKGIPLTRVTAARLAMEFEAEYDFVFLRPGVFCFNDLFAAVADEVGWHEPTRIGGHPGWAALLRRRV